MTSTSRKRRALLAGTAAVGTAFALAVPLMGTAAASHVASLDLSPVNQAGAAGTCLPFTITVTPSGTNSAAGVKVDVVLTESSGETAPPATQVVDADFCTAPTGATTPVAPDAGTATDTGTAGTSDRAEFTTGANGTVTFGVTSSAPSTISVFAFAEEPTGATNDNVFQAGEANDTSTATFGAGGPAGTNAAADSVQNVSSPTTASGFVAEAVSIPVTLRNAAVSGQTVAGVTPNGSVTTGPSTGAAVTCTASNNEGVSTCTYTPVGVGTDTLQFWVNQTDGPTGGFDAATEPGDTTAVSVTAAVTGLQIDVTCGAPAPATDTSAEDCVNFTNDPSQLFTATVTRADGADVGTDRDPASGILVRWTENGSGATLSAATCTTDAAGVCSVTVTEATPTSGEVITVTGSIAGQNPAGDPTDTEITSDSATLSFTAVATAARIVTLTPTTTSTAPGGVSTFTATVTDANGQPVRGVTVTFSETGAGFFRTPTTVTTNAAGQATVESTSSTVETGSQTVTATIDSATTDCELTANNPTAGNPAGACSDSSTNTFASPSPSPSPTSASPSPSSTSASPTPTTCVGGPATVALSANVTQITAGNSPTLSGTVSNSSGAPCRTTSITVFQKRYGATGYTALATVTTNNSGQFTLVVRPLALTAYGANTAGNAQTSNIVVIRVYTRINIDAPATPTGGGATPVANPVTFRGTMNPPYAGVAIGLATLLDSSTNTSCFAVSSTCRFVVLQQTTTDGAGGWTLTRTLRTGPGVYILFTSAHQGTDKGSKSTTLNVS